MTITLEIKPEVQAELARQADAHGGSSRMLQSCSKRLFISRRREEAEPGPVGENTFREMGQFSHKIPSLPDDAFTRESLYQDHD